MGKLSARGLTLGARLRCIGLILIVPLLLLRVWIWVDDAVRAHGNQIGEPQMFFDTHTALIRLLWTFSSVLMVCVASRPGNVRATRGPLLAFAIFLATQFVGPARWTWSMTASVSPESGGLRYAVSLILDVSTTAAFVVMVAIRERRSMDNHRQLPD